MTRERMEQILEVADRAAMWALRASVDTWMAGTVLQLYVAASYATELFRLCGLEGR